MLLDIREHFRFVPDPSGGVKDRPKRALIKTTNHATWIFLKIFMTF
jgi:hypothetical protein